MQPMQRIARSKSRWMSWPQIVTLPRVGLMRPTSMRIVVVFPAPLGPRKPKTSPAASSKETLSTIVRLPMTFVRSRATSVGFVLGSEVMRRALMWYVPAGVAFLATAVFGSGFYSFVRGDIGVPVARPSSAITAAAPQGEVVTLVIGDSLARGTGDSSGLGIGGRVVEELQKSRPKVKKAINISVNGSRTADVEQQLKSRN